MRAARARPHCVGYDTRGLLLGNSTAPCTIVVLLSNTARTVCSPNRSPTHLRKHFKLEGGASGGGQRRRPRWAGRRCHCSSLQGFADASPGSPK